MRYTRDFERSRREADADYWRERDYGEWSRPGRYEMYERDPYRGTTYRDATERYSHYESQRWPPSREWRAGTERGPVRSTLLCRDIMTRNVATCTRDMPLREAAQLMKEEDVGAIPVVEGNNRVVGIITDRDIVCRCLADKDKDPYKLTVKDCMTEKAYTVRPSDRVVDAIGKMGDKEVRRILVTDSDNRLKGIISMADIALETDRDDELADAFKEISEPKSW